MGIIFLDSFIHTSHICKSAYQNWWILLIFKLQGVLSTLLPITLINSAVQPNRSIPGSPEETEAWDCTSAISCLSGPWLLITLTE